MTRITQRCFLVLAFTGVLLSYAQETTVSGPSEPNLNELTSSSAPASSLTSVDISSLHSITGYESSTSHEKVFTSEKLEVGSSSGELLSSTDSKSPKGDEDTFNSPPSIDVVDAEKTSTGAIIKIDYGGYKASEESTSPANEETEHHDEKLLDFDDKSSIIEDSNVADNTASHDGMKKDSSFLLDESEKNDTNEKAVNLNKPNPSDSIKTDHVPSEGEPNNHSSHVAKNSFTENLVSSAPSKIQTESAEENNSSKDVNAIRSLNATNAILTSSEKDVPIKHVSTPLESIESGTEIKITEKTDATTEAVSKNKQTKIPFTHKSTEQEQMSITTPDPLSELETHEGNVVYTDDKIESGNLLNSHSLEAINESPESSGALSISSSDSIHSHDSSTSHAFFENIAVSTLSSTSYGKNVELESEGILTDKTPSIGVTFDPNGMTNNYTQDPDSITFAPIVVHIGGVSTSGYLSHLKINESSDKQADASDMRSKVVTVDDQKEKQSSEHEKETQPERERNFPHDEPDIGGVPFTVAPIFVKEVTSSQSSDISIKTPSAILAETRTPPALNDESEEMLNDSPHFDQSNPMEFVPDGKNEETHSTHDSSKTSTIKNISQTVDYVPQSTTDTVNELVHSIAYQTEQSVVRPVTVATPLKTPEISTPLTNDFKAETHTLPVVNSEHSDTVLPDISSPIIQPNPAPSIVNETSELTTTTIVLHPELVPKTTLSDRETVSMSNTSHIGNSTIAGVAVKTSVSVSLPLSTKITENDSRLNASQIQQVSNVTAQEKETPSGEIIRPVNKDNNETSPSSTPSTSVSVSSRFRIRKPKLKFTESDEPDAPMTRKPFTPAMQRSTTTAGPPVSIFKKSRTRIASITSSTTPRPFPQFSTIRIHYASRMPEMLPNGQLVFSIEPVTTTVPTTTETEEPFSIEPFTDPTHIPKVSSEDDVTLVKVAGYIVVEKGLRWTEQLHNRHSPQYKEKAHFMHVQLERLFRSSPVGSHLWKIQIDGFSVLKDSRSVVVDFFLYLIKSEDIIPPKKLTLVFHEKLKNNTFSRFRVDPSKTTFEINSEEPMKAPTPPPENEPEPPIPQWAIAVIVIGAASLIFIVLFAAVTMYGRHHMRRRYSNKLNDEDSDRPSDWESKMAAAYENLAADTIYDVEDMHSETYKKSYLVD